MSELEERLNALLSSPEDMSRVAEMASRLMGEIAPGPPPKGESSPGGGERASAVGRILSGLKSGGGKSRLLEGMSPYLQENRRKRLEKALRLAAAARLAGTALTEMEGTDGL